MADYNQVKADIDQLVALQHKVERDFKAVIVDKSIPLADRWKLFCKAPDELKTVKSWVWNAKSLPGSFNWYEDYDKERYTTIDLINFVDQIEEDAGALASGEEAEYYFTERLITKVPDIVEKLKEEILADCIRGFVYDW